MPTVAKLEIYIIYLDIPLSLPYALSRVLTLHVRILTRRAYQLIIFGRTLKKRWLSQQLPRADCVAAALLPFYR